ncbi:Hypothetical_protein [Hexamita inflata]|uniref:Hypothetical_protein n=1 Tax=Hexamita inflata TaxID=28002 RepID=A0AA86UZM8_9EUKA|nr:Hypothetical protein HINF_LOCUS62369 [Hexamita inflata]
MISRIFDKSGENENFGYRYQFGVLVLGVASLITASLFIVIGSIILIKFRRFATRSTKMGFITIACLIFLAGFSRFMCLFYKIFFKRLMDTTTFAILCYLLPDLIPCIIIMVMQLITVLNQNVTLGPLVTEPLNQMLMTDNH